MLAITENSYSQIDWNTGETKLTAAAVLGGWSAAREGKKGEICTPSMYLGQFVGIGVVTAAREVVKGNVEEVG